MKWRFLVTDGEVSTPHLVLRALHASSHVTFSRVAQAHSATFVLHKMVSISRHVSCALFFCSPRFTYRSRITCHRSAPVLSLCDTTSATTHIEGMCGRLVTSLLLTALCAVRPAQGSDCGQVPSAGPRHSLIDGMKIFIPRKMEFQGWVTDQSKGNLQGITDDAVSQLQGDLERVVPQHAQKGIDWDQTKKEQGTWPRKIMVSMWFKHETNLVTMIDLLNIMKEELDKAACKSSGQSAKARMEVSPQRRPFTKGAARLCAWLTVCCLLFQLQDSIQRFLLTISLLVKIQFSLLVSISSFCVLRSNREYSQISCVLQLLLCFSLCVQSMVLLQFQHHQSDCLKLF